MTQPTEDSFGTGDDRTCPSCGAPTYRDLTPTYDHRYVWRHYDSERVACKVDA